MNRKRTATISHPTLCCMAMLGELKKTNVISEPLKIKIYRGWRTQGLIALATLAEDLRSVPSTHIW